MQDEYSELISPERVPQLKNLGDILTQNLRNYVPSASVKVSWEAAESINMPIPKANVKLEEDGFDAPVNKVGHGLQRAFIISVLQSLIGIQYQEQLFQSGVKGNSGSSGEVLPNIILAIEEPELYQHPNRQRHLSRILFGLSRTGIAGVAKRAQVIYCTHSPLFVDLSRFDSTRRLTKIPNPSSASLPRITWVAQTNMDSIAKKLESVQDEKPSTPFTSESLKARMVAIMTPWVNEGFFADIAVLVEGEDDRSAIMGTALAMGIDLEAEGIAIIPCGGKENIDRPFLVFSEIGIPVYVVFDGDGHKPKSERGDKTNRILQKLLQCSNIRDIPIMEITEKYATFDTELDRFLRSKIGEEIYTAVANRYIREFGYPGMDQCKKSPAFVCEIIEQAEKKGVVVPELQQIIESIRNLPRNNVINN
jgi:putative ATP-dependent endonuclease of OLD family